MPSYPRRRRSDHEQAACRNPLLDPDLWHGADDDPKRATRIVRAKAVCAGCTVRQECLEVALANNERLGVWGGLTPEERRKLAEEEDDHE
jgi:WhiB family redox-sensing transcriptional regulator